MASSGSSHRLSRRAALLSAAGLLAILAVAGVVVGFRYAAHARHAAQPNLGTTFPSTQSAPAPPTATTAAGTSPSTAAPSSTAAATSTACTTAGVLATWPTTRLAEQTVVVPVTQSAVSTITPEVAAGAGGVILFGSSAPPGLATSLAALKAAAPGGIPPFVMSDEEGGAIQRMPNIVGTVPSARQMGATMTPGQITALAAGVGEKLRGVGVTMDLAPVLDLDGGIGPNAHDAIGTRSFGTDPAVAGADGVAFAQGLRQGGVVAVVKHFPGLGGSSPNTDFGPAATLPWSTLQAGGLLPYEQAVRAGVPAVMISNATVPGLTALPASLSPSVITTVLRGQLGFHGLVLTDSLSAGAISGAGYSVPSASVAALRAGADMVLFDPSSGTVATVTSQTVGAVVAAVAAGTLSRARLQDAVGHVLAAKGIDLCR